MKSEPLLSYALDFVSFLMQKTARKAEIKQIILYGSVARGEAGKDSDIDLFVDVLKFSSALEKEIQEKKSSFLKSAKVKNYWSLLGINNELRVVIGELEKWKELHPSLIANGLVLYGKYLPAIKEGKHQTFFIWENVKPNSRRVLFNKQLFGFTQNEKHYDGLLQKYAGERLGKGCISVALEHAEPFLKLFRRHKVSVRIKKVLEYGAKK